MKTQIKAIAFILAICTSTTSFAQSSANATASAQIVTPITITSSRNLSFGNIAVQAGTGGDVVLASDGNRTSTGGVTLPATSGTVASAEFTVAGQANYTYNITLPGTVALNGPSSATMNASSFTASVSTSGASLNSSGSATFTVGATLGVAAGQAVGTYTSGNFAVTVNYN